MRLLDYDPVTGIKTYFAHDPVKKKNILKQVQDVEPFIAKNKFEANALDKKKSWWHIGTIPDVIVLKWSQECGHPPYSKEWQEYALKQLQNPDYRAFNQNNVKLTR